MLQDIRELTSLEMNHVFGGEIVEDVVCEETPPKENDSGAGVSSFSADLFFTGVSFALIGAAAVAAAPFVAVGAVGLAISGAVLSVGGGFLVNAST
jgi:hypothetical protein